MPTEGSDTVAHFEAFGVPMTDLPPSPASNPEGSDSSSVTAVESTEHTTSASDESRNKDSPSVDSDIKPKMSNNFESSNTQQLTRFTDTPITFQGLSTGSKTESIVESEIQDGDSTGSQKTEPERGSETAIGEEIHLVAGLSNTVASQADHSTQMRSWPTKNEIIAAIPADGITGEALMNIFGSTMKDEGLRAHIRPFVRFDQKRKIVYLQKEPLPHGQQKDTQNTHSKSDNRTLEHRFGHAEGYIQPRSNGKDVLASGRARHMALPRRKRLSQLLHILNAVCAALHHEFGKVKPEVWDLLIDVLPEVKKSKAAEEVESVVKFMDAAAAAAAASKNASQQEQLTGQDLTPELPVKPIDLIVNMKSLEDAPNDVRPNVKKADQLTTQSKPNNSISNPQPNSRSTNPSTPSLPTNIPSVLSLPHLDTYFPDCELVALFGNNSFEMTPPQLEHLRVSMHRLWGYAPPVSVLSASKTASSNTRYLAPYTTPPWTAWLQEKRAQEQDKMDLAKLGEEEENSEDEQRAAKRPRVSK